MPFDVIIIGSGLGGLLSGNMLAMEGLRVCVLEKNKQIGGNLQTFARDKQVFDTGVHYIGGLDKGQNLCQVFKYVGLMDALKLEKMDEGFDGILIDSDPQVHYQLQGYDKFIKGLSAAFPEEKKNIIAYCDKIKETCASFPLYNLSLKAGDSDTYKGNDQNAKEVIASITSNKKLQAVLAGNNLLYAGVGDKTPFHVHALIENSYIESSWKCVGGGSQIAKILAANLRKRGGEIIRNCEVKKIVEEDGVITHVETEKGRVLKAKHFISNLHPVTTINITESGLLKKLYRSRIENLEQSTSSFSLHLVLKEKSVVYQNRNYYYHKEGCVWELGNYTAANWPLGYGLYFTRDRKHPQFASTVSILTPMRFGEVEKWKGSYNRAGREALRGADYETFKKEKTDRLLNLVSERFPEIVNNMKSSYASTPLTNRDYIGDATGAMYGIQKDYHDPLKTMISPRTKIPNLFLTGQNLNLHGILGTSLSAVLTCCAVLNDDSLVDKIKNA